MEEKRILITSTDVMAYQFLLPHAHYLCELGYRVDMACSFADLYENEKYHEYIKANLPAGCNFYSIQLCRSPFSLKNRQGLRQLKTLIAQGNYDLIWTNEPVMGVMTRLAAKKARKKGTKVLYLAHGYHFYQGCPKKNWLAYPVEKWMSRYCDAICLINWEDYHFTLKHIKKKSVYHIDGIGLDTNKFQTATVNRNEKREALGFREDDILLLSVGELQKRKNHEPVIRALAGIENEKIKYLICGCGELEQHLKDLVKQLKLESKVFFLGHRYDIPEILKCVDVFIHPSLREGLGIAALEAMSVGLPLITSDVQGIKDYMVNGKTGFILKPFDIEGYRASIEKLLADGQLRQKIGEHNRIAVQKYDIKNSEIQVSDMIREILNER